MFAVLGFIAAVLSIPGMPRIFSFSRNADSNKSQAQMTSAVNTSQPAPQASQVSQSTAVHHRTSFPSGGSLKPPTPIALLGSQTPHGTSEPHSTQNVPQKLQGEIPPINPYENQDRSNKLQNPYQRIGELYQRVQYLSYDWYGALQRMDQDRARPYKMGMPGPMPKQLSINEAQRLKDTDEQISSQYASLGAEIVKAHQEAISYMNLTPNQISEDEASFSSANSVAGRRMTVDELLNCNTNRGRFQPIGTYLQQLQHRLGDYH